MNAAAALREPHARRGAGGERLASAHLSIDSPTLLLRLSHTPQAVLPSGAVETLAPRDAALFAWLALEGPTPRGRIAALLWPASDAESARNALRQRLFRLRQLFGRELVSGSLTLALADGVEHDLDDADAVLGDAPADDTEFGAWLTEQRGRRRNRMRESLAELADMAERAQDMAGALVHAQELLALDALSEDAHRRVMRLHYLAGDRAAALLAFDRCERVLKDEVGATPSAETLALLGTIEASTGAHAAQPGTTALTKSVPASVLRPPRLVGRERELAALRQGWQSAQVVTLIGEAGMGKSRVLQAFAQAQAGVVGVSARPGDAGVPFATLARLLRTLAGDAGQAAMHAPTRRELARVLPEWGETVPRTAGEGQRLMLLRALRALLGWRADVQGVYVDDLHFADSASIDMLRSLVDDDAGSTSADTAAPRWLLAYRPIEADSPLRGLHDGLVEQARLLPVALAPLDEAALAELVDSLALPGVRGAALAAGLLRRTGGNPLFVLETLKQAWVERTLGELADAMPRPLSVMRLIDRRLTQLSPGALALARCAAVAGQEFSTALAAQVLGAHPLALADAWAELEQAQVLRDQAFAHDLYFEAALASVPAAIARHLHGDVAAFLEHAEAPGAAPATLARHWLAAQRSERAVPYLERAARAAQDALDPALAASFLAQLADAQHEAGNDDAAFDAALEVTIALRTQGSGAALAQSMDRLAALARTPRQQAAACEARAAMHHLRGEWAEASAWVERALAALGSTDDPNARIKLLNMKGVVLRRAGQLAEARAALEAALMLARDEDSRGAKELDLPAVLNNLALVLGEMDDHLGASGLLQESAGRQTDPLVRARVLNNLGISLEERGQSALAYEQRLAAARLCSAAASQGTADLVLALSLGANARNLARYREALVHLEHAKRLAQSIRHWREEDLHGHCAAIWLDLGRVNLAREALEAAERAIGTTPRAAPELALVKARYCIAAGKDALAILETAEQRVRDAAEHRALRRLLVCKAQLLPAGEAVALMRGLLELAAVQDNAGASIPAHTRMAQALLGDGQIAPAVRHAQRAADALSLAVPLDMSCAEVWLTLAQTLVAVDESAAAAAAAATGKTWLARVAQQQIDEPYRDGWLHRNRVNATLLALAAKLASNAG